MSETVSVYAKDGVNVAEGDSFSAFAASTCAKTSSRFVRITDHSSGFFRGPRTVKFVGLPKGAEFDFGADGVGTKSVITAEAFSPETAGYDVVAMCSTDITVKGGMPLVFVNVLDVATLGNAFSTEKRFYRRAIESMVSACNEIGVLAHRGETAELGACVGSENPNQTLRYNWAGFMLGAFDPKRIITGNNLEMGDVVIALRERGFRSNGLSAVRGALREQYGSEWWNVLPANVLRSIAYPATLYDRFLTDMHGWRRRPWNPTYNIKAIAHITGGGIVGKFARDILFPRGYSAVLDTLWQPPEMMQRCAQWRGMSSKEAYKVWNSGQGVLVVVPPQAAEEFCHHASSYGIEAKRCGFIRPERGTPGILITSKYSTDYGVTLPYYANDEE